MNKKVYQIRYAAGMWWLIDVNQNGFDYKSPQSLNDTGMYIYIRLSEGKSVSRIAEDMNKDFGISVVDAIKDIKEFIGIMDEKGILREG